MTPQDIIESGLLELYVLNELSGEDKMVVESALENHPEVKKELTSIEESLEKLANAFGILPSAGLKAEILKNIHENGASQKVSKEDLTKKSTNKNSRFIQGGLLTLLLGSLLLGAYYFTEARNYKGQLIAEQERCDSLNQEKIIDLNQMKKINNPQNVYIAFTPTEKFQATDITLLYNSVDKSNFLKVNNLPIVAQNKTFQLWSLKEGQDPIPMTTFNPDKGAIIPLDFETGTKTYAITIEAIGGALTPDLTNLIATVNV